MSYNVHITRAEHWTESDSKPISLEEAKIYFAGQEDFEYSSGLSVEGPFGKLAVGGDFLTGWRKRMKKSLLDIRMAGLRWRARMIL